MNRWVPLESNPQVMSQYLHEMGVPSKWNFSDVYGLDDEMLGFVPQPAIALVLLYPLTDKSEEFRKKQQESMSGQEISPKVFFMKQYISNACGTVALIHALANNTNVVDLNNGPLKDFINETGSMSPEDKGHALGTFGGIVDAHEQIAKQGQTAAPERDANLDTHFIVFVNVEGKLYELDGRKDTPISHGNTDWESFLKDAAKKCQEYIKLDPAENRFAIMALSGSS